MTSLFTKQKNQSNRILPQQWLFGALCREADDCFTARVHDRIPTTLIGKIKEHIEGGSINFSDSWKVYKTEEIHATEFEHFKVYTAITL